MTAGALVAAAATALAEAGVEGPVREAGLLLRAIAATDARLHPEAELGRDVAATYVAAVGRRARREPYAYIVGYREFAGVDIEVTRDVLIPRPETEMLVQRAQVLAPPGATVCDLCTGSGCIALALAKQRPDLEITATDISAAALAVAERNAARLGVPVRLRPGDLWQALPVAQRGRLDLCTCNPPYVEAGDLAALAREVRDWEPGIALVPAAGWRSLYRRLASGAVDWLRPGGHLLCEVGAGQAADVAGIYRSAGLVQVRTEADLAGMPRMVEGRRPQ